ncbi:MAG TPA: dephospho-CoA kinase [Phycisphaerae bacterium]
MCGGIGAGKSTVAELLAECGAVVIDSDALSHAALNDPVIRAQLRRWWGPAVFDSSGRVDRQAVAGIVFKTPPENERLKGLLYPWIAAARREQVAKLQVDPRVPLIVLNSPLLFEAGLDAECDGIIFVDAERDVRLARVRATRGWSATELERRENLQMPLDIKRAKADYILRNNSSIDELRVEIKTLFPRLVRNRADVGP